MTDSKKTEPRPEQRGEHQALRQEILEDARRKARRILEKAQREVNTLKEQAQADLEKLRRAILDQARVRAERRATTILAPLDVEARRETLNRQDEVVQDAFRKALAKLANVESYDYNAVLTRLVVAAVNQMAGAAFIVTVNERDRSRLSHQFLAGATELIRKDLDRTVSLSPASNIDTPPGVIVTVPDGRQMVDNTFPARLNRFSTELRLEVAGLLFAESGEKHD